MKSGKKSFRNCQFKCYRHTISRLRDQFLQTGDTSDRIRSERSNIIMGRQNGLIERVHLHQRFRTASNSNTALDQVVSKQTVLSRLKPLYYQWGQRGHTLDISLFICVGVYRRKGNVSGPLCSWTRPVWRRECNGWGWHFMGHRQEDKSCCCQRQSERLLHISFRDYNLFAIVSGTMIYWQ